MATLDSLVLLSFICSTRADEWCSEYSDYSGDYWLDYHHEVPRVFFCETSCCGSRFNRYCCWGIKGSTIAGIVSGCVLGLALIAAVIIAVFCCLKRRRGVQGQVMGPVVSIPMATATAGTALASPGGGLNFNGPGGSISQFTGPGGSVTQFTGPGGSVTQFTGPGGRMAMTTTTAGNPKYPMPPPAYTGTYNVCYT